MNDTGVDINNLYVSETGADLWGRDILGRATLPNGARTTIFFYGETACFWDMKVTDATGGALTWGAINLCAYGVVVLHCGQGSCWATFG